MKTFLNLIVLVSQHQMITSTTTKLNPKFLMTIYFIQFCDVPKTSNQLQEDLAKPSNKSHTNVIF